MNNQFTLVLNREPTDVELDLLYELGCHDASIESGLGHGLAHFDREGDTASAVVSAIDQVESAGLKVRRVETEPDYVTLKEIAERTGRTYESIRLISQGKRGNGFPAPVSPHIAVWRWRDVVDVLDIQEEVQPQERLHAVAAVVNGQLAIQQAMPHLARKDLTALQDWLPKTA
ncbi:MAG: hypothetical protein WAS05_01510 [Candidatus Nanopelagicales bacterium]